LLNFISWSAIASIHGIYSLFFAIMTFSQGDLTERFWTGLIFGVPSGFLLLLTTLSGIAAHLNRAPCSCSSESYLPINA